MNDSTKNEILTGLTGSVELMMSQISDVQVDVPDAEEIADHFDASDIAEHINISACDVANNLDMDDVATYVADNLDTNDVADHIDVSDLATYIDASEVADHINASDVADYIDYEKIADHIDISKVAADVANHMLTKSYEESDGSATEEFPSYFSELSLELKLIRNLVSSNEVLAKQLREAKAISSDLEDSIVGVMRERNELKERCSLLEQKQVH